MKDIIQNLSLIDPTIISKVPNRPEIFIEIQTKSPLVIENEFKFVADGLVRGLESFPKTLIFAYSINTVANIYEYLKESVIHISKSHHYLVSMFHSQIGDTLRATISEKFFKT